MKLNSKKLFLSAAFLFLLLAVTGCPGPLATLPQQTFVYPELKNTDYKSIDKIDVITDVKLTGDVQQNDSLAVAGALYQTAAEKLTTSGLYRTTDIVWGNLKGASELEKLLKTKNSSYGYAHYVTETQFARAKLYLTVRADVKIKSSTEQLAVEWFDRPHKIVYRTERRDHYVPNPPPLPPKHLRGEARKQAEKEYREKLDRERKEWLADIALNRTGSHRHRVTMVQVPYSIEDRARWVTKTLRRPVTVFGADLVGTFTIRLVDKKGKLVFSNTCKLDKAYRSPIETSVITNKSKYTETHHAPPTVLRLLTSDTRKFVQDSVAGLIPQYKRVEFQINQKESNVRALALLTKGVSTTVKDIAYVRSFEDVLKLLEPIKEKTADDHNCIGIAYAGIGDYPAALSAFRAAAAYPEIEKETAQYVQHNMNTVKSLVDNQNKQKQFVTSGR